MKKSSRTEYLRRIDRIVARLSDSIANGETLPSVAELAALANLSEFHFMRVYRALAGEALGATVQRLRLQHAVHLLKETTRSITDIATAAGYETPQAFAKAFRLKFGAAPSEVRERPAAIIAPSLLLKDRGCAEALDAESSAAPAPVIRVEIVQLAPFRVAALRNHGAYADLDQAYVRLFGWIAEQGALDAITGIWGVPHHDRRDTPPAESVFDCCLATDAPLSADADVRIDRIGGGAYLVHRHIGGYAQLDDAHDALITAILSDARLVLRDAPILHHFINEPDATPESELETHVYAPVEEKSC